MLWEHPVGGKKSKGWADIALKANDRIWALIKAKAPGANLHDHVEQVLHSAFYEGVDICALSTGRQSGSDDDTLAPLAGSTSTCRRSLSSSCLSLLFTALWRH